MCVFLQKASRENRLKRRKKKMFVFDCFSAPSGTTHTPRGEDQGGGEGHSLVAKAVVYGSRHVVGFVVTVVS